MPAASFQSGGKMILLLTTATEEETLGNIAKTSLLKKINSAKYLSYSYHIMLDN